MISKQVFLSWIYLLTMLALLIGAYINGFRFMSIIRDSEYALRITIIFLTAYPIAYGLNKTGNEMFGDDKPWHLMALGCLYSHVIALVFVSIFHQLTKTLFNPDDLERLHPQETYFLFHLAILLWHLSLSVPVRSGYRGEKTGKKRIWELLSFRCKPNLDFKIRHFNKSKLSSKLKALHKFITRE